MLALLAGGGAARAASLGLGMLLLQFTIGATNDLFDERLDESTKPWKPIPSGLIGRRLAWAIALLSAAGALAVTALYGIVVLGLVLGMLAAGLAYNAYLKRGRWAWLAYALAFPQLLLYAWFGAAGSPPPRSELLLPLAALAAPALQLANGMVDLERDRAAGINTPAVLLGRRRSVRVMGAILVVLHGAAWMSLLGRPAPATVLLLVGGASTLAAAAWSFSGARDPVRREMGWKLQAAAVAVLAAGWLAATLTAA